VDHANFLLFGLKAGGLLWLLTGAVVFLPLFAELALPLWGQPGRLGAFTFRSLLALVCACMPGGSLLAAWVVLRNHGAQLLAPVAAPVPEPAPCALVIPAGATLAEGCRFGPAVPRS
jgi:hypothetical protein